MTIRRTRHIPAPSLDTNASGIADSTISNGSWRLSQFPPPPSSIPTPSEFGTPSPSRSLFSFSQPSAHPSASPSRSQGFSGNTLTPSSPPSPYDWHEGASSIDVDATEDRLLPTSFITSLLQQDSDLRKARRTSYASDAVSGISEITYPPPFNYPDADSSSSRYLPGRHHRPYGARNPPSAFAPIPENNRISGDSETLHSTQEHSVILRTASVSRGLRVHGASVVGVAPATLHNISSRYSDQDPDRHDSIRKGGLREIDDDSIVDYKVSANRTALPSLAGTQRLVFGNSTRQPPPPQFRESVHSSRSVAPSFISRISLANSLRRAFTWRRVKPLPPVPTVPHIPIATENEHRKAEESTPLPNLINRAGILHNLLEKGHHPHHSFPSYHGLPLSGGVTTAFEVNKDSSPSNVWQASASALPTQARSRSRPWSPFWNNKRICLSLTLLIGVLLVGIITAVVMTQRNHHSSTCANDLAGAACNLNSTCVCTLSTRCDGLAKNIVDLIPQLNGAFSINMTANSVYNNIWLAQGSTTGSNCASQSLLVDVGKNLDQQTFPNRTHWAQTSLLWNVVQSQDLQASTELRTFVQNAPWQLLQASDGPLSINSSKFTTTVSGFTFNFATQTISQPPVSFITQGQPTNAQVAQVGSVAGSTLDRMYSFALASSTQRDNALKNYWTTTLQQRIEDLATFKTALSTSPILLPFNGTSPAILSLYNSSLFPPPLACYPGLGNVQLQQITALESGVFGLSPASNATQFDAACYPNHPVYGVLDVLRLRLPFLDSETGVAHQAAVLKTDVAPRAVVYTGAQLSTWPNTSSANFKPDPRSYGTLGLSSHIVLQYLSSIPDVSVASALVKFVLNSTSNNSVPPDPSSPLFQFLSTIPVLEVAVFGSVEPADIGSAVASFALPSGSLFFGSVQGSAFRNWAITTIGGSVAWTETPTSPLVVRDNSLSDVTINQTWTAISTAIQNHIDSIGLANITQTFQITNKFTS